MKTDYAGIDYSLGQANVSKSGIHYGVIAQNSISGDALNEIESVYAEARCPECGGKVKERPTKTRQMPHGAGVCVSIHDASRERTHRAYMDSSVSFFEYACDECRLLLSAHNVFDDEPIGMKYERDGYRVYDCLDFDLMVVESPYFTFAQFCSPCVPGAGNLDSPCEAGPKTYCLGHDWFEGGQAPYPVYSVETGELVNPE